MITAIKPNAMLTETDPMSTLRNLSPQDIINASTAINSALQKVFSGLPCLQELHKF